MKKRVNNQTKIADRKNLQMLSDITTKLSQIVPTWVIETGVLTR